MDGTGGGGRGALPPLEKMAAEAERHPRRGRSRGGRQLEVDFGDSRIDSGTN